VAGMAEWFARLCRSKSLHSARAHPHKSACRGLREHSASERMSHFPANVVADLTKDHLKSALGEGSVPKFNKQVPRALAELINVFCDGALTWSVEASGATHFAQR
jgi:hypothetical protein